MRLVNLTPHEVRIIKNDGDIVIKPGKVIARVESRTSTVDRIDCDGTCVDIVESSYGKVVGLPEPEEDTIFIVSRFVKNVVPERDDVLVPNGVVRDENGSIIGCWNLGK